MIKLKLPPEPEELAAAREKELEALETYFGRQRRSGTPPKFKAYKTKQVAATLNSVFGNRCAYCESFYGATQPVAIEHYRPKGTIIEDDGKLWEHGYYWLAAVWSNLMPSCTDCNSERYHTDGTLYGKGMRFPLERRRRKPPGVGCERREKALLLNPWQDEPSKHLEFPTSGNERGTVRGKTPKGATTIRILGLNRPGLVQARKALLKLLDERIEDLVRWQVELADRPRDQRLKKNVELAFKRLLEMREPSGNYIQMCRQLIDKFMKQQLR